jgi:hypothetical protein
MSFLYILNSFNSKTKDNTLLASGPLNCHFKWRLFSHSAVRFTTCFYIKDGATGVDMSSEASAFCVLLFPKHCQHLNSDFIPYSVSFFLSPSVSCFLIFFFVFPLFSWFFYFYSFFTFFILFCPCVSFSFSWFVLFSIIYLVFPFALVLYWNYSICYSFFPSSHSLSFLFIVTLVLYFIYLFLAFLGLHLPDVQFTVCLLEEIRLSPFKINMRASENPCTCCYSKQVQKHEPSIKFQSNTKTEMGTYNNKKILKHYTLLRRVTCQECRTFSNSYRLYLAGNLVPRNISRTNALHHPTSPNLWLFNMHKVIFKSETQKTCYFDFWSYELNKLKLVITESSGYKPSSV